MSDKGDLVDVINRVITRRTALGKFVQAFGALLVGIVAAPKTAHACFGCCNLCITEPHGFDNKNCDCIWGWKCPDQGGPNRTCQYWQCEECIKAPTGGCTTELCWTWYSWNVCAWGCELVGAIGSRATPTTAKVPGCTPP